MTTATIRKWGNSLALRLPSEVANHVNFKEGSEIEMLVSENNEVVLRPLFPNPDNQEALRAHFLALRDRCKPGMIAHEEQFQEPMGDEMI